MVRKSTLGPFNPLDAVIPTQPVVVEEPQATPPSPPAKQRLTVLVSAEVLDRLRDACFWSPVLTVSDIVEDALVAEIARLEKDRGEPFPKRTARVKTGRPVRG